MRLPMQANVALNIVCEMMKKQQADENNFPESPFRTFIVNRISQFY